MYDKVLVLCEVMVRYWYCANIPPRSLEDKTKKNGIWSEKAERKKIGPIREGEKTKKNLFGNKIFSQDVGGGRLWKVGGWEVGGWAVRIEKSVRTVERLGR